MKVLTVTKALKIIDKYQESPVVKLSILPPPRYCIEASNTFLIKTKTLEKKASKLLIKGILDRFDASSYQVFSRHGERQVYNPD